MPGMFISSSTRSGISPEWRHGVLARARLHHFVAMRRPAWPASRGGSVARRPPPESFPRSMFSVSTGTAAARNRIPMPSPGSLSTQMSPPCASTIPLAMASPMPVPGTQSVLARRERTCRKCGSRSCSSMPGPRSRTRHNSRDHLLAPPKRQRRTRRRILQSVFHQLPQGLRRIKSASAGGRSRWSRASMTGACAFERASFLEHRRRCRHACAPFSRRILPASICAMRTTSATRRFIRSASSSMMVSQFALAASERGWPAGWPTAALMEVSGVLIRAPARPAARI